MMKKQNNELEKELREIGFEINSKHSQIITSPKYKSIENEQEKLKKEYSKKIDEYEEVRNKIYSKYLIVSYGRVRWRGIKEKYIKSSVKQGIKNGLGIKNLKFLKWKIVGIVKKLIANDMGAQEIRELGIEELKKKDDIFDKEKEKLINDGTKTLLKKKLEINKRLEEEEKKQYKKQYEVNIKIKNLPKYMDNIEMEINKRLMLDGLK